MDNLLFGTAGIPLSGKGSTTAEGIARVKKLGLGAMELEFVQSVNISEGKAVEVKQAAKENNIILTANSGSNTTSKNKDGNSIIETGNAYVSANALNFVNNNMIWWPFGTDNIPKS